MNCILKQNILAKIVTILAKKIAFAFSYIKDYLFGYVKITSDVINLSIKNYGTNHMLCLILYQLKASFSLIFVDMLCLNY